MRKEDLDRKTSTSKSITDSTLEWPNIVFDALSALSALYRYLKSSFSSDNQHPSKQSQNSLGTQRSVDTNKITHPPVYLQAETVLTL
ncbi:hypothetical protein RRG08_017452 [Elysia crispata]|uniref:Uncharacterized protein n=1 Tax=Elysia crispata TaxID=231223 RepID=A0AAE1DEU2_9GAST|nr:hypothetical protein RRG08_017452 [Elysia crispata]